MSRAGNQEADENAARSADHYIPLRPADLVRKLSDEPQVTIFDREQFRRLCELFEATLHHEYRSRLREIKTAYAPFDPDDDVAVQYTIGDDERAARCGELFDDFDALLM